MYLYYSDIQSHTSAVYPSYLPTDYFLVYLPYYYYVGGTNSWTYIKPEHRFITTEL